MRPRMWPWVSEGVLREGKEGRAGFVQSWCHGSNFGLGEGDVGRNHVGDFSAAGAAKPG